MSRLLNKPLKVFTGFAALILACSIPVYFLLVESIWLEELDDHNHEIKMKLERGLEGLSTEELEKSINLWNRIHPESGIFSVSSAIKDSLYTIEREIMEDGAPEIERFRGLFSSIELNGLWYSIRIETNVEEVHETVLAIALVTCFFIALLIVGFILLNRYLSKQIWRPFTDTLEKLKRFDLNSDSKIDFAKTDITEFEDLNATLYKLIENNTRAFRQQKEFAQNASHELQTPLALLKSKLDLLIQQPSLTEEQRAIIESLDNSVSRITRINKNLLLLARIENKEYESSRLDLGSTLRSLSETFKGYSGNNGRDIKVLGDGPIHVNANESLVEIMINNLLSNAIRHGDKEKPISVFLNKDSFSIKNFGSPELNPEALFKRFISANSQNQGTGLGLAIIKEVCDKYGWKISYVYSEGQHVFSVSF